MSGSNLSFESCTDGSLRPPSLSSREQFRPKYELDRIVFFVGFMGAGKTSLARRLARQCGCASIDLDRYIERIIDCSIASYFEQEGEAAFREMEAHALSELVDVAPAFISCGGGIVEGKKNRSILRSEGFTVYLKVSPEEAVSRISNHENRPLLSDMDAAYERAMEREPLYESVADLTVDTAGYMPRSISWKVRNLLLDAGVLVRLEG